MKNIFKTGKRGIAAILTLCILLGIAGTYVYAASAMAEETATTATEETTPELVPMMASGCYQYWVPDTWNLQYMDQTMAQIVQSNGWSLGGITQSHYHLDSDSINIHYVVYR